jgi:hypothetical protein
MRQGYFGLGGRIAQASRSRQVLRGQVLQGQVLREQIRATPRYGRSMRQMPWSVHLPDGMNRLNVDAARSEAVPAARLIERDRARATCPAAILVCHGGDPGGRSRTSPNLAIGNTKPHDFPVGRRNAAKNCPGSTDHLQLSRDSRHRQAHCNVRLRDRAATPGSLWLEGWPGS